MTANKAKKPRKNAGTSDYNAPITDDQKAMIWTLTEEGVSQREIGRRVNLAPSTVSKELAKDPISLEALRARQREDRSTRWKEIENLGLDEVKGWLEKVRDIRLGRGRMSKKAWAMLPMLPRFLQAVRHTAETGTKQVQLLTGGVTERIDGSVGVKNEDLSTQEQIMEAAIEMDMIDQLPPRLRPLARAEAKKRGQG